MDYKRMIKATFKVKEKETLSDIECLGLEKALENLIKGYEEDVLGCESLACDIAENSYVTGGALNIHNDYRMDKNILHYLCLTDNHVLLAYASNIDDEEDNYYLRVN